MKGGTTMKCEDVRKELSSLIDNEVNEQKKKALLDHIDNCEACKRLYEEEQLIKEISQETMEPLPDDFEDELHAKLLKAQQTQEEAKAKDELQDKRTTKQTNKTFFQRNKKIISIAAVFLVGIALITALPLTFFNLRSGVSRQASNDAVMEEAAMEESAEAPRDADIAKESDMSIQGTQSFGNDGEYLQAEEEQGSSDDVKTGRMIIKRANIRLDIEGYDDVEQQIIERVDSLGGFISNAYSNVKHSNDPDLQLKQGHITAKVPSEEFNAFLDFVKTFGKVQYSQVSSDDITDQYRDTVTEIENLEATEERLRELYDQAETVEEILEIERELSRVRTQIDQLKGTVKNWERLTDLSTIEIELNEVESLDVQVQTFDQNIFEKSKEGLIQTINQIIGLLEAGFVKGISYSPFIVLGGIVLVIFIKLIKRR